ncbi:MAG TPA: hypothetical protein DHV62_06820 [Elusimicrobia bacterium]|jgi:hypothetical protein|nr:hypothetical protein [Elusimicrobiota bacterium]
MKGVILFPSTHYALRAEEVLNKEGLIVKLIPVPREFSSNCGIALEFDYTAKEKVNKILKEKKVETESIQQIADVRRRRCEGQSPEAI